MKKSPILLFFLLLSSMFSAQQFEFKDKFDNAVPVLNVATFHMGETSDATSTEFDEHNPNNQNEVKKLAKKLAKFKPTIIIIEDLPKNDSIRNIDYLNYIKNPDTKFKNPDERELLAYEVGRLSGAKKIHGIDYKEGYNYRIESLVSQKVDKKTTGDYWTLIEENEKINPETGVPFQQLFKLNNQPKYLESLININADILTYVSSKGKSEGADEAAKFYHRNLVMFSNLNQIQVDKNDRIFILMGGTHTAFFMDFLRRSPKYLLENTLDYLK
ncbi:DUF5694 domain-containing protein [Chryseobacterium taiwanense]|uniref:Polysaccharide deacetylase n=1 Tax=Chryseobacterium taiwanense TaxID=363331 RepID=A0A0B4D6M1_9FLAO|nr:DUF5694 domain-containing protein [Chryseobacterium taiwanense]KIC62376.1 hypothetical protein RM51_12645 [Chryseobacterium taiwanense]